MKVSVALCTYNGEKYLQQQLTSILSQTTTVDEVIICDDVSNDGTQSIVAAAISEYGTKVKLLLNEHNLGPKANFQKVLNFCSGDLIFLSDQDDIWKLNKVETVINFFSWNPDVLGVFTNGKVIDDAGRTTDQRLWDSIHFDEQAHSYVKMNGLFDYLVNMGSAVTGATLTIKREALKYVLPFQRMDLLWHDEWIALCLASLQKLSWIDEELICYRVHQGQQVGIPSKEEMELYRHNFHRELSGQVSEDQLKKTVWKRWFTYQRARQIAKVLPVHQQTMNKAKSRFEEAYKVYLKQFPAPHRFLKKIKFYTMGVYRYSLNQQELR